VAQLTGLRGRNPANRQRSPGRPLTASADEHGARPEGPRRRAGCDAGGDEHGAGIGDQWHPGIAHQRDDLAILHALDELARGERSLARGS